MPMNARFKRYGKRAGLIVLTLVVLDLAAGAAAVALGAAWLRR